MKVYLAYAIDQAQDDPRAVPSEIRSWLQSRPWATWVFDPGAAFEVGAGAARDSSIREVTSTALLHSDMVVAWLPRGVVSIGVPMEIQSAISMGIPVTVISDAPSWMLEFGDSYPESRTFSLWGDRARQHLDSLGASGPSGGEARAPMPVVVEEGAELPRRGFPDDAGLDLVVSESVVVQPGEFADIPCGVRVELPSWSWGLITGRSSTLRSRGLMVVNGVIDAGYRGPLFAGAWNLTEEPVKIESGERIAQLILLQNATSVVEPVRASSLAPGSRGDAGFGSTGA